jgi:recombination protein RecT
MENNTNLPQWKQAITNGYKKFELLANPNRAKEELGFAMQIFENNTYLQKCNPTSILNAVLNVARTSITLNPVMKLAYLIPRRNQCILEFSYMGLIAMLRDNGCIKSISAHIVYADEEFDYINNNEIHHKPKYAQTEQEHKERGIIGCYSRAVLPTGDILYEFMPMWEIDKVKRNSENSASKYSAWNTWRDEMIKKSVLKRHFKMLISGNPNKALQVALEVEQNNNPLINQFSKTTKRSIMDGFSDTKEVEAPKLQFEEESAVELSEMSDEEIESAMQEEAEKQSLNQSVEKQRGGYMGYTGLDNDPSKTNQQKEDGQQPINFD